MGEEAYYPAFVLGDVSKVRIALDQLDADPLWLDRDGCPYDERLIEALRALWGRVRAKKAPVAEERVVQGDIWDEVTAEAQSIFDDIRSMREDLQGSDNPADAAARVAFYRMAPAAMEKVIQLGERAQNIKEISDFKRRVLDVFDQVLDPEQRTRATEILSQ